MNNNDKTEIQHDIAMLIVRDIASKPPYYIEETHHGMFAKCFFCQEQSPSPYDFTYPENVAIVHHTDCTWKLAELVTNGT